MLAGIVRQVAQPPVFPTAKLPTGAFVGLSSTTSTRPLTPPAAPEATRASNWLDPDPKLTPLDSRESPVTGCAAARPSTPAGRVSPVAAVTEIAPRLLLSQSAEMSEVAVVVQDVPPPPLEEVGLGEGLAEALGLGDGLLPVVW